MLISVCLLDDLVLGFYHSNLTRETCGLEIALAITLVFLYYKATTGPSVQVTPNSDLNVFI